MKILLINNAEPDDWAYNAPLFDSLSSLTTVESVDYRRIPSIDMLTAHYDGIVLSGVPVHYDFDTINSRLVYLAWVRKIQVPLLGICLGHENIGRIYGSEVLVSEEAEDGLQPLRIMTQDSLFEGIKHGDRIAAHHRASITVPDNFVLLASTPGCHNQAMKHKEMDIYGIQFHPELSGIGGNILSNFVDIVQSKNTQA